MENIETQITAPSLSVNYDLPFTQLKEHIYTVINTFRSDYKFLDETDSSLRLLVLSQFKSFPNISSDLIIVINDSNDGEADITANNEKGFMRSYTEAERGTYAIDIFQKLLAKAVNGTLAASVANMQTKPVDNMKGIIQLIMLIVAVLAIYLGIKGLLL